MKNTLIAWLFCLPFASCTSPVTQMDLSGQWTVCLDSTDVGMNASFGGKLFDTSITLPGTTDEACLGTKCTLKPALEKPQLLHLTRAYSYVGPPGIHARFRYLPTGKKKIVSFIWNVCYGIHKYG